MMAVDTVYHHEPLAEHRITVEKVRFDYVRTLTDLYIENMLRPFAAFLHANGIAAARRDQLRAAVRADPARPRGRRHRDRVAGVRLRRSTRTGCWPVRPTCSASSTRRRPGRPPATTCSTTASTTRSSPPSSPPASPRPCCTAGPAPPAPRASPSGRGTRACGRCSPSGSTPGSPAAEFYPLWNDAIGRYQCLLRQGRPRIDVGILRTDHFTDNMSGIGVHRRGRATASPTRRRTGSCGCATARTTGGRTSACRTPAGRTSSSTGRCCCTTTCPSTTGSSSPTGPATRP